jgi:beta-1,2-mannobiose phosphorylase / 1,2-beta-oligomannan phosphorylase
MELLFILILLCLVFLLITFLWRSRTSLPIHATLERLPENPILAPIPYHWWESAAVFNPAAIIDAGRVHLFYRAMGGDGVSRIGYASSPDGIHFDERLPDPVYDRGAGFSPPSSPQSRQYRPLSYDTDSHASGGGWGGCEDPRSVTIDDHLYMTFGVFESWGSIRLALTRLSLTNLAEKVWQWAPHTVISPPGETHKNWVLFPEKINGKFAILHALTPGVSIEYLDSLDDLRENPIQSNNKRGGRESAWDAFVRGSAAPPLKTKDGWLLFYHGMDPTHPEIGYKLGAMILDLNDPTKILYRCSVPVLEPREWYENDWKPGVIYGSGAVILGSDVIVYYGGGDKYIAAAKANLNDFLHKLTHHQNATLEPVKK